MMMQKCASPVLSIKAMDEETGEFEGYASTFGGEPDSYGDVIVAGAFQQTLEDHAKAGTMPRMFWQHDPSEPIGKWIEASEDDTGLLMKGRLNLSVQRGREAHALLKSGDIDGLSIGYRVIRYEVDEESNVWYLKQLDLAEVSVVSIPANVNATVNSVKSLKASHEAIERLKAGDRLSEREFESVLKGALGFSNSQAERAARACLKGRGEPADAASEAAEFFAALREAQVS